MRFCYPAKGGVERSVDVADPDVRLVIRGLLRSDTGHDELLVFRNGRSWVDVRSGDINDYLRDVSGIEISAKDFRTWHGTVLAARLLAQEQRVLGYTPAVARASYVDPRVVDLYRDGVTIPGRSAGTRERSEAAVLELLADATGR